MLGLQVQSTLVRHGVYASKVSYGVTSEADEPAMGSYTRAAHAHANRAFSARTRFTVSPICTHVDARFALESMLPLCRPAARKNLSVEAGNAIEVITSLITTLHAIRDREFVFHERTASTMHPFSVLSSPTLAFP